MTAKQPFSFQFYGSAYRNGLKCFHFFGCRRFIYQSTYVWKLKNIMTLAKRRIAIVFFDNCHLTNLLSQFFFLPECHRKFPKSIKTIRKQKVKSIDLISTLYLKEIREVVLTQSTTSQKGFEHFSGFGFTYHPTRQGHYVHRQLSVAVVTLHCIWEQRMNGISLKHFKLFSISQIQMQIIILGRTFGT